MNKREVESEKIVENILDNKSFMIDVIERYMNLFLDEDFEKTHKRHIDSCINSAIKQCAFHFDHEYLIFKNKSSVKKFMVREDIQQLKQELEVLVRL